MKTMNVAAAVFLTSIAVSSNAVVAADAKTPAACDRQQIMQIDSAKISMEPDGFQIDAFGTSESAGWKEPTIVFAGRTGEMVAVDFVACRPEVSAQVLTPIQTRAVLDLGANVRQIVIRARTNSMTVEITKP
jgi:hypothetical protein